MVVAKDVNRSRSGRRRHKSSTKTYAPPERARLPPAPGLFSPQRQVPNRVPLPVYSLGTASAEGRNRPAFLFFACALRTGFSECGSRGDAPSGGLDGSRSRAGRLEPLWRESPPARSWEEAVISSGMLGLKSTLPKPLHGLVLTARPQLRAGPACAAGALSNTGRIVWPWATSQAVSIL